MRSMKRALLAYTFGGVALAVLTAGAAVYAAARSSFRAQLDGMLLDRANTMAALVIDEQGALEFEYDQPLDEEHVGVLVQIVDPEGGVVAQSSAWPQIEAPQKRAPAAPPQLDTVRIDGRGPMRSAIISRFASRDPAATGEAALPSSLTLTVRVLGSMDEVREAQAVVTAALVVGAVLSVLGSLLAVWIGVQRGLAPVRELGEAVEQIDAAAPELPVRAARFPNELQPIVTALDGALARLTAAINRERRFTDAAAHELRTPLAELRTITDVADRWPEPERLRRAIRDAAAVARDMESLLVSLLAAARGLTAESDEPVEHTPLLALARSLAGQAAERLGRTDLEWTFEGSEQAAWKGPRGVVTAIVRNLIDNAAEYSPRAGAVVVRSDRHDGGTFLEVENGPVDVAPEHAERLFEPFWRADAARSGSDHRGLGLSIADSLGRMLDLERQVEITPHRRLRFRFVSHPTGD